MRDDPPLDRRTLLTALAGASTASLAGCPAGGGNADADTATATSPPTTPVDDDEARRLAERYAPTLYFDAAERWYPTDPRPYTSEQSGETVVTGFDALDGYVRRSAEADGPPDPTVFYNVVEYANSPLTVVQFWFYSVFDQFTTNFHWHDWEVLHVFVDTETETTQLFVASSHSPRVPNNEHLDPASEAVPRVLSELGSHSSALSLNDRPDSFQRLPLDDLPADITNRALSAVEVLSDLPAAYGLPRDEGFRLPYLVPELDGAPVYDHERLPAVDRDALIPDALTIRSFDALSSPPTDLPARETGVRFDHAGRASADPDVAYDLVPTSTVEHVTGFTGPQLSFEFAVPEFAEDALASHITTAGTPWNQQRYSDPVADITDPAHRSALADRYDVVSPPGPLNDLVATITELGQSPDAPEGDGVRTTGVTVEAVAFLQSDPVAAPTFRGVAMLRGVESGDHRITVNGAGLAPHAEPVSVGGESDAEATTTPSDDADGASTTTLAGVDGEIPLVAREHAVKLEVDADAVDADLTNFAVDDDFGGRLYEVPLAGPDAVYVHRDGAYTAEVTDADDAVGAFRVNPADTEPVRIDRPRTGKASLASFVEDITTETADQLASVGSDDGGDSTVDGGDGTDDTIDGTDGTVNDTDGTDDTIDRTGTVTDRTDPTDGDGKTSTLGGLLRAMEAVSGAAGQAAERAEAGDRTGTDRALEAVSSNLQRAIERFEGLRGTLPGPVADAADRRFRQAQRRTNQAIGSEKL